MAVLYWGLTLTANCDKDAAVNIFDTFCPNDHSKDVNDDRVARASGNTDQCLTYDMGHDEYIVSVELCLTGVYDDKEVVGYSDRIARTHLKVSFLTVASAPELHPISSGLQPDWLLTTSQTPQVTTGLHSVFCVL